VVAAGAAADFCHQPEIEQPMTKNNDVVLFWMPEWSGFHLTAWREQDAPSNPPMNLPAIRRMIQLAERGKFHACFLADVLTIRAMSAAALSRTARGMRFEPITLLSALSACTDRIGLLATSSTTYNEPFHVARMFASLDHLSGGRAGWNVVTSGTPGENLNFGREEHMDHAQRYERSQEFFDVVTGLWDSWEDDAYIGDKTSGIYFDPQKLHALDFRGEHLSVAGPLHIARPVQGHPVIAQAGSSDVGRAFAARNADVVYTLQADIAHGADFYGELKEQVAANGRAREHVKVLPALKLLVGRSQADADEKLARLDALVEPDVGLEQLAELIDADLSDAELDGPVPDVPETERGTRGRQKYYLDLARRDNLTVRQLMQVAARRDAISGSARDIADTMQEWVEAGAADGFNITFIDAAESLEVFVDEVVPELQRRGLFHTDYRAATLRENLGLPRPANRLAAVPM
jgi:FMN-dependent oxidoreductase (nitrilotriacetate monooxygenase family)